MSIEKAPGRVMSGPEDPRSVAGERPVSERPLRGPGKVAGEVCAEVVEQIVFSAIHRFLCAVLTILD